MHSHEVHDRLGGYGPRGAARGGIRDGAYRGAERNDNLTLVEAPATLLGEGRVQAGDDILTAPRIVINVGARPGTPPIEGLDRVPFLTSREALDLREVPEHFVVIGGGYVGVEFAQMYARFGSRVTIIHPKRGAPGSRRGARDR